MSVRSVATSSPPITGMASGARSSIPSPRITASGRSPSTVVSVEITMGRRRSRAPSRSASSSSMPWSRRSWFTVSSSTMALFTTIPASMTTPIRATTEMGVRVIQRLSPAPTMASGTDAMMTMGCRNDSNWLAMTR
jgi:hypothetical protein